MSFVYIISPVGSDPDYASKRAILLKVARKAGVALFFPLDQHRSFSLEAAVNDLRRAQLVIADLSLERPSCYFEVGLAQAVGVPIVFIAAQGTMLHQAGSTEGVLTYSGLDGYRHVVRQAISRLHQSDP